MRSIPKRCWIYRCFLVASATALERAAGAKEAGAGAQRFTGEPAAEGSGEEARESAGSGGGDGEAGGAGPASSFPKWTGMGFSRGRGARRATEAGRQAEEEGRVVVAASSSRSWARRTEARSAARFCHVLLAYSSPNGAKRWKGIMAEDMSWRDRELTLRRQWGADQTYVLAPLGLSSRGQQAFNQSKCQR